MRSIIALTRAAALTAASYRLGSVLSLVGLVGSFIPVYFIAQAMQPVMSNSIQAEGGDVFGFWIFGIAATMIITAAVSAVPLAISSGFSTGTLEALLVTRTSLFQTVTGLSTYPMLWAGLRATLLVLGATVLGMPLAMAAMPYVLLIGVMTAIAYLALGLFAAAMMLVFRTAGPFNTLVVLGSGLLGGVYFPSTSIPSWIQALSEIIPLTYGLRAARQLALSGLPLSDVSDDMLMLTVLTLGIAVISVIAFRAAMLHARKAGTLAQY